MVTKMEALFRVRVAQKHLLLSCFTLTRETQFTIEYITNPICHHSDLGIGADS